MKSIYLSLAFALAFATIGCEDNYESTEISSFYTSSKIGDSLIQIETKLNSDGTFYDGSIFYIPAEEHEEMVQDDIKISVNWVSQWIEQYGSEGTIAVNESSDEYYWNLNGDVPNSSNSADQLAVVGNEQVAVDFESKNQVAHSRDLCGVKCWLTLVGCVASSIGSGGGTLDGGLCFANYIKCGLACSGGGGSPCSYNCKTYCGHKCCDGLCGRNSVCCEPEICVRKGSICP